MEPPEGLYVKYTFKFVDKIKDVHIMPYDMLVSFDVEALFPSFGTFEEVAGRTTLESGCADGVP
jgi:hypothetical protein